MSIPSLTNDSLPQAPADPDGTAAQPMTPMQQWRLDMIRKLTEWHQGVVNAVNTLIIGIPAGGTANQVLTKVDATDYNTKWATPSAGGSSNGYYLARRFGA